MYSYYGIFTFPLRNKAKHLAGEVPYTRASAEIVEDAPTLGVPPQRLHPRNERLAIAGSASSYPPGKVPNDSLLFVMGYRVERIDCLCAARCGPR